ncbi:MAG: glycosyltransferase, partial [Gammaproteobacteria bacterium]|nr:glycosyltransferase [Gammaproteobacteria bacterium]
MRVLLCHNNFGVQGGAEVFVHEVARVLTDNGHDVAFLAAAEEGADTEWASYFPQAVDYAGNKLAAIAGFGKMVYSREARNAASRLIRDFKPDIVHCFAIYTRLTPSILDAFREANIPVVCSFNDYKHICPSYKLYHHN